MITKLGIRSGKVVPLLVPLLVAGALFCTTGCGDSSSPLDAGDDAGIPDLIPAPPPPDLTVLDLTPPPPPSLPQLQPESGVVLTAVKLVTITFTFTDPKLKYAYSDTVEGFGDYIVGSDWIATIGKDYGVGKGTHIAKARIDASVLPDPHGITDSQVTTFLRAEIANNMLPMPDGQQTLYMIYFPSFISVTQPNGESSCGAFGGFHSTSTVRGGNRFAYAVIADCGGGFDGITVTASHELAEAISDPYPNFNDAYRLIAGDNDPWVIEDGEENGDMCNLEPFSTDAGYVVQRIWSNTEAAAGRDPCIPGADPNYYNVTVSPALPTVTAGKTVSFQITGWVNGKVDPWTLTILPAANSQFQVNDLQPQLVSDTMYNGHNTTIRLTIPPTANSGDVGGVLVASGPQPYYYSRRSVWPVAFVVE